MKLGCRNWLAAAQGRGRWRHLLEKACRADDDDGRVFGSDIFHSFRDI